MRTLYLDLETYCERPITHGTHAYAETAEVLLAPYAWDEEPVRLLDLTDGDSLETVADMLAEAGLVVIHNSAFDRTVLRHQGVDLNINTLHDTMVQAMAHSLPGALDKLCDILAIAADKAKDKDGKRLIQLFCKPMPKNSKLRRATRHTHPEEWERFKAYAMLDVESMRAVFKALPTWNLPPPGDTGNQSEVRLWRLDQKINDRGFAVDTELARAAVSAAKRASKRLAERTQEITDNTVQAATQRDALLRYFREEHGFEPPDLKKGTVKELLKMDLPPEIAELLEIRLQASATSPAKYGALLRAVSSDDRLRGTLQFAGALRTARWGGRLFQPQNLPRPTLKGFVVEMGIRALKTGVEDLLFDNVMDLCGNAVRGAVVASPGCRLHIADLSNIEGRTVAWLAGEQWKLRAFKDYDTILSDQLDEKGAPKRKGHDLYKVGAAGILGIRPEDVTDDQRQVWGKVPELACAYGGSVGAFAAMGLVYGVSLPEDQVRPIVQGFRKRNGRIVALWYDLERAVRNAVLEPGLVFRVGHLAVRKDGSWLRIRLPSGRYLCYPGIEVDEDGGISYMGVNQYTRKWERIRTYGGKLTENVTQAASRDVLAAGMERAEAAGYRIVLHVHDEIIVETPDTPEFSAEGLAVCMSAAPHWAIDLPLSAAGFETYRYRKG